MRQRMVVPLMLIALAFPTMPATVTHGAMIPSGAITKGGTQDSLNWAGYASLRPRRHRITGVTSTFVVPAVNGTTPGFAATWTGIGGFNSSDLIQAGVEEDFIPGSGPTYAAWYELLPDAETPIAGCTGDRACTVRPHDVMTVRIAAARPIRRAQRWVISIRNGRRWSYVKRVTYRSSYSSAEWILEAPTVGAQTVMPMLETAKFDPNNRSAIDDGPFVRVGLRPHVRLTMNTIEGVPSDIDHDGDGFNACAYATTCPVPLS